MVIVFRRRGGDFCFGEGDDVAIGNSHLLWGCSIALLTLTWAILREAGAKELISSLRTCSTQTEERAKSAIGPVLEQTG